jgi:hypothetical protein
VGEQDVIEERINNIIQVQDKCEKARIKEEDFIKKQIEDVYIRIEGDRKEMIDEIRITQKEMTRLIIRVLVGACIFFLSTISVLGGIIWANLANIIK